jgi:hypothetical protein
MKGNNMTNDEFNVYFDKVDLSEEYMVYIMENCHGERSIGNGDDLIIASEEGYLYEEFREYYLDKIAVFGI